jgi:DNA-binding transcriptional ArsR family regulator
LSVADPCLAVPLKESDYKYFFDLLGELSQTSSELKRLIEEVETDRALYFKLLTDQFTDSLKARLAEQAIVTDSNQTNEAQRKSQNINNYKQAVTQSGNYNSTTIPQVNAAIDDYNTQLSLDPLNTDPQVANISYLPSLPTYQASTSTTAQSPTDAEIGDYVADYNTKATALNTLMSQAPYSSIYPSWTPIPLVTYNPKGGNDVDTVFVASSPYVSAYIEFMKNVLHNTTVSTGDILSDVNSDFIAQAIHRILGSSTPTSKQGLEVNGVTKENTPGLFAESEEQAAITRAFVSGEVQAALASDLENAQIIGGMKSLLLFIEQFKEKKSSEDAPLTLKEAFEDDVSDVNASSLPESDIKKLAASQVALQLLNSSGDLSAEALAKLKALADGDDSLIRDASVVFNLFKQLSAALIAAQLLTGGDIGSLLPDLNQSASSQLSQSLVEHQEAILSALLPLLAPKLSGALAHAANAKSPSLALMSDQDLKALSANLAQGGSLTEGLSSDAKAKVNSILSHLKNSSSDDTSGESSLASQIALSGMVSANANPAALKSAFAAFVQDQMAARGFFASQAAKEATSETTSEKNLSVRFSLSGSDLNKLALNLLDHSSLSPTRGLLAEAAKSVERSFQESGLVEGKSRNLAPAAQENRGALLNSLLQQFQQEKLATAFPSTFQALNQAVNPVDPFKQETLLPSAVTGTLSLSLNASDLSKLAQNLIADPTGALSATRGLSKQAADVLTVDLKQAGLLALSNHDASSAIAGNRLEVLSQIAKELSSSKSASAQNLVSQIEQAILSAGTPAIAFSISEKDMQQLALNLSQGASPLQGLSQSAISSLYSDLSQAGLLEDTAKSTEQVSPRDLLIAKFKEISKELNDDQFASKVLQEFGDYQEKQTDMDQFLVSLLSPSMLFIKEFSMQTASQQNTKPVIGP